MARSLTVNHQEKPGTNALFTGFLVHPAALVRQLRDRGLEIAAVPAQSVEDLAGGVDLSLQRGLGRLVLAHLGADFLQLLQLVTFLGG